jgi:tetratricopeptide (TPR) repeat protein
LELNPSLEGVYYNLGNLALGRGEVSAAIQFYRQTLARNPSFANAYNNLGQAYEAAGDLSEAWRQYQQAVESDPHLGGAWFNLGAASERLDKRQTALTAFSPGARAFGGSARTPGICRSSPTGY